MAFKKVVVVLSVCFFAFVMAELSDMEHFLKVPLLEVGGLWIKAIQEFFQRIQTFLLQFTDLSSTWTYLSAVLLVVFSYYAYKLTFTPLNRVRKLGDLGYIPEGNTTLKETVNAVRKRRMVGDVPPVYPNGWFSVLESRDLKKGQVKNVGCLGLNLAVFRGEEGRAHVVDAYCPHLGANLAIGGRVFGDCLECPFHGWKFRGDDGKCVHIPYSEKVPNVAKVKSYNVIEINGFIYIWYHAESAEPSWTPPELVDITTGQWSYQGRTEHIVNSHIQEVPENGADIAHLPQVHGPFITAGVDLQNMYSKWWEFGRHHWVVGWEPNPEPEKHIGSMTVRHRLRLFGIPITFLDMNVLARQIGPGIVHLSFKGVFGNGSYQMSLTPIEPMVQRMVHHVHMNWFIPPIIGKFFMLAEAIMIERDIMIWNNKRYVGAPVFVKSTEDQTLQKHRRWFSQFYSENSPRLSFRKDDLSW